MNIETITLKISGKAFDDESSLKRFVEVVKKIITARKMNVAIICGGGKTARSYIQLAGKLGITSKYWLDEIGIMASRLNAELLIAALQPYSYPKIITSPDEALEAVRSSRIIVSGGLIPGQSTSSVAVQIAEALGSSIIIDLAAVDMVYDKDPSRYPDARSIKEIDASALIGLLEQRTEPGRYELFDRKALEQAIRSSITIYLIHYTTPERIWDILDGGNPGTVIYPR